MSQAKVTATVSRKFGITAYLHIVFKERLSHGRACFSEKLGVNLESRIGCRRTRPVQQLE